MVDVHFYCIALHYCNTIYFHLKLVLVNDFFLVHPSASLCYQCNKAQQFMLVFFTEKTGKK